MKIKYLKRKILSLMICFSLIITSAMPGTLSVFADEDFTDDSSYSADAGDTSDNAADDGEATGDGEVTGDGEQPGEVVEPTEPEQPGETVEPTEPEQPGEVVEPTEPEQPGENVEPTEPEQPGETVEPTEPEQPGETVEPTEPEQPGETVEPTEPEQPGETVEPTEPEQPGETVEPTEPEQPGETVEPTELEQPGAGVAVETPAELTSEVFYNGVMAAQNEDELEAFFANYDVADLKAVIDELDETQLAEMNEHMALICPAEPVPEYTGIANADAAPLVTRAQFDTLAIGVINAIAISNVESAPYVSPVKLAANVANTVAEQGGNPDGLCLDKTAVANDDDTYTITLEAYVTGAIKYETTSKPVDIVLVLDSSGSMDEYIVVANADDETLDTLDTVYGADEGIYEYNDKVAILDHWQKMKYEKGKWYYAEWAGVGLTTWDTGNWIELGSEDNWSTGSQDIRIKKINALKIATQRFVDQVQELQELNTGDEEHRIAVVSYGSDASTNLGLTNVSSGDTIKEAIKGLNATGATRSDLGMQQAKEIINGIESDRNSEKVVIMFTDGVPTKNSNFESDVANAAIASSKNMKSNGVTVYTIGIFDGVDDTVPMPSNASDVNKYMHYVSSNFANAESMTKPGTSTYPTKEDGTSDGSYYLGATNADRLNQIFENISDKLPVGGAKIQLDAQTVITDVVAQQFNAPTNAEDIKVYTAAYQGYNAGKRVFAERVSSGLTATIDDDKISVNGFDFSSKDNCVTDTVKDGSTTYSGNKLIIEFTVTAKDEFLGGNNVYTNDKAVLTDDNVVIGVFPEPQVNVPIKKVTVTAADKNVYLLGSLTAGQIKAGATADCGGIHIDLSKSGAAENWGLASWQTEYVNITVTYTDAAGNTITDVNNLQDDTTYKVTVTVKPKDGCTGANASGDPNPMTGKSGSDEGKINVFKPELTFKDSEVYYGADAPESYDSNKDGEATWKHGDKTDSDVTMLSDKPTLELTYTPDTDRVKEGKIAVKSDIPVDVTVKIGEGEAATDVTGNTTFKHTNCEGKTCNVPEGTEFLLHVKTCSLTITKKAGDDTTFGSNESFIFNIKKDGVYYTQVTITGTGSVEISELPVGTYTVTEDTNWSWRYAASYNRDNVELSSGNPSGGVTVTNSLTREQWLNGVSAIVKNVFGPITAQ